MRAEPRRGARRHIERTLLFDPRTASSTMRVTNMVSRQNHANSARTQDTRMLHDVVHHATHQRTLLFGSRTAPPTVRVTNAFSRQNHANSARTQDTRTLHDVVHHATHRHIRRIDARRMMHVGRNFEEGGHSSRRLAIKQEKIS
jgi:hypothetical protein